MAGEPRGSLWKKAGWPLGQSKDTGLENKVQLLFS